MLISSFINNLNKFITCCFSVIVGFSLTLTFASTIGFLVVCVFTSTVTFLLVSTSKFEFQGVKKVSSAITSKRILPVVSSSIRPFSFLIGISHFPDLDILPLNNNEYSGVSTTKRAFYFFKLAPCNDILHSKSSALSVNNLYIIVFFNKY